MKYPIGIQDYGEIRCNGYVYVDKTALMYFQIMLYVFFKLIGFYVDVECHTTNGRMDILIQTPEYIYILEFKLNQNADIALQQIEDKGYAKPFASDHRKLFKIGINFSTERKLIDDWKINRHIIY